MISSWPVSPFSIRVRDYLVDHRVRFTVALYLGAILIQVALGSHPPHLNEYLDSTALGGLLLLVCGLGLRTWAAGVLRKGKALTTTGPYALCRHPLYLGTFLMLTGFAMTFPGITACLPSLGLLLIIFWVTMRREERSMTTKYGTAWEEYAAQTPCLLPLRFSSNLKGAWSLAQWWRSREYNAVAVTVVALGALMLWGELQP